LSRFYGDGLNVATCPGLRGSVSSRDIMPLSCLLVKEIDWRTNYKTDRRVAHHDEGYDEALLVDEIPDKRRARRRT